MITCAMVVSIIYKPTYNNLKVNLRYKPFHWIFRKFFFIKAFMLPHKEWTGQGFLSCVNQLGIPKEFGAHG